MLVVIKLLLVVILPVTLALITFRRSSVGAGGRYLLDRLLFWYLVILVGGYGTLLGFSQMFNGEWTANLNGWPYSPFVIELGFANLAFGLLGLSCVRIKGTWWYAAGVAFSLYLGLAAYFHVYDFVANNNTSAGNSPTNITLWTDIVGTVALLVLCALHARYVGPGRETLGTGREKEAPAV